jgi:hypothetical protein
MEVVMKAPNTEATMVVIVVAEVEQACERVGLEHTKKMMMIVMKLIIIKRNRWKRRRATGLLARRRRWLD